LRANRAVGEAGIVLEMSVRVYVNQSVCLSVRTKTVKLLGRVANTRPVATIEKWATGRV